LGKDIVSLALFDLLIKTSFEIQDPFFFDNIVDILLTCSFPIPAARPAGWTSPTEMIGVVRWAIPGGAY
jgi:hypothetical protein